MSDLAEIFSRAIYSRGIKGDVLVGDTPTGKSFSAAVVKAGWDESLHPRGDDGRFINKDEISAASKSPAKAAELRKKVTDPKERNKLEKVLTAEKTDRKAAGIRTGQHGVDTSEFGKGLEAPPSRQPLLTDTLGEHPDGDRPGVHETVALIRNARANMLDQAGRAELADRIGQHSVEELNAIKRQLGLRASGRKAELAAKILLSASGHDYPEQGFTGALPVKGQGIHHYENGVLSHIEREPSPGMYSSRVTPEEAHAVIDYYIAKGTLLKKESREEIAKMLMHRMSYRDIAELKDRLGLKASGRKEVFANKIMDAVESRHRAELEDPNHDVNRPDPVGTLGSLAERKQYFESMRAMYGNGVHPQRQESIDDAANRLQLAIQSPFTGFNRDAAEGEARSAINDLYSNSEMLAAAAKAGLMLNPKDGKIPQQIAAALARVTGNDENPSNDEAVIGSGAAQHITPAHHTHRIVGNTFKHKDDIVKAGGVWNGIKKQWSIDEGAADFLHPELKLQPLEEAKAAGGFQRAKPENHTHRIIGDTYPNREAIKQAGGAWDAVGKYWTIDADGAKLLPKGIQAQPLEHRMFADTDKLAEAEKESKEDAGYRRVAENIWNAQQRHLENPKPGIKPPADEFLEEVSRKFRPRSLLGRTPEEEDKIAGHLRQIMARESAKVAKAEPEQSATAPASPEPDPTPGRTEHLQAVASGAGVDELRDAADTVSRIEDIPHSERTADDRAELKRARELAAASESVGSSKQPHELTQKEYIERQYNHEQELNDPHKRRTYKHAVESMVAAGGTADDVEEPYGFKKWHERHVDEALKDGKHVPPHVLAEYPELAKKHGKEPRHYVDDHPEITADNPLGLPTVADREDSHDSGGKGGLRETISRVGNGDGSEGDIRYLNGYWQNPTTPKNEKDAIRRAINEHNRINTPEPDDSEPVAGTSSNTEPDSHAAKPEVTADNPLGLSDAATPVLVDNSFEADAYHATDNEFSKFDPAKYGSKTDEGLLGSAAYLSTDPNINRFGKNKHTLTGKVRLKNPLRVKMTKWSDDKSELVKNALGLPDKLTGSKLTDAVKERGHDGVVLDYSNLGYEHQEIAHYDPKDVELRNVNASPVVAQPPEPDTHAAKLADLESRMAEAKRQAANKSNGKGDRAVWERHHDELDDQHAELTGRVRTLAEHEGHVKRAEKRKDHERLAKLKGMEAAVHAQHIDNHVKRLDKRIAKMDEANTWAAHVGKEYGKIKWDGQMETVYSDLKEAHESGMPKHLFADAEKGEKGESIETIAKQMQTNGSLQVPEDRHADDYLIEKLSSGETFDGGHDEHRQSLAAERDAIHSERDGKPETDAAIVATLKAGRAPKGKATPKAAADVPASTGAVTESPDTPKVADVKQHSLDEIMASAAGQDVKGAVNGDKNEQGEVYHNGNWVTPLKDGEKLIASPSVKKKPTAYETAKREASKRVGKEDSAMRGAMGTRTGQATVAAELAEGKGGKMPHKTTLSEVAEANGTTIEKMRSASSGRDYELHRDHKRKVENALRAKLEVPKEVLADYPDLVAKYKANRPMPRGWGAPEAIAAAKQSAAPDPDAPDTSTQHGKASAVPIGVTQKDDYESRGRGVRKAVESPAYLLPL